MSLLLDALKKAADDKQKALQLEQADSDEINENPSISGQINDETPASDNVTLAAEELSLQSMDDRSGGDEALTLDEENSDSHLETGHLNDSKSVVTQAISLERQENTSENKSDSDAATLTLSDEALSMLIYKTNREVKKGRRILVSSIFIVSLGVLVSGGMFYYKDMQEEISMLERKHQIAMQAMRSKTNDENMSSKSAMKSEIIRNLVSDADLEEKVLFAKQKLDAEKVARQADLPLEKQADIKAKNKLRAEKARTVKAQVVKVVAGLSIQKKKKADPVGEKLETAWLAYESARYGEAAILYKSVLSLEKNNRDALLGLAAIAVIEKNYQAAKNRYLTLLELDPHDPIATAALASLPGKQSSPADQEYLLSVLKKNPNAHHLNFVLGNIYAQQNNWKSAQQYYFNAWQHNNENADYVFNLAVSMDQLGKQEQALKFYEDSLFKSKNKQPGSSQPGFSRKAVRKRISELSESRPIKAADESSR